MENVSKALLIAAAVLIVIIIVSISIKVLNSPRDSAQNAEEVGHSISVATKDAISKFQTSFDKGGNGGTLGEMNEPDLELQPTPEQDSEPQPQPTPEQEPESEPDPDPTPETLNLVVGQEISSEELLKILDKDARYTGKYKGKWKVIPKTSEEEEYTYKLVSIENIKNDVKLGSEDVHEGIIGNNALEKAISSYSNVVENLDADVKEEIGEISGKAKLARSITIEDLNAILGRIAGIDDSDYGKSYEYDLVDGKIYSKQTGTEKKLLSINFLVSTYEAIKNNLELYNRIKTNSGIKLISNYYMYDDITGHDYLRDNYWLASPCVYCNTTGASFCVYKVWYESIEDRILFSVDGVADDYDAGVRAIVLI